MANKIFSLFGLICFGLSVSSSSVFAVSTQRSGSVYSCEAVTAACDDLYWAWQMCLSLHKGDQEVCNEMHDEVDACQATRKFVCLN